MKRSVVSIICLVLAGCASPPPPPPVLTLNIIGGTGQNPDASGQGTSVAVRVYQLSATGRFESTDIYTLASAHGDAVLGTEELGSPAQYIVSPDQHLTEKISLNPGTTSVGVVVLFRDASHSVWKLVTAVAAHGQTLRTLHINGLTAAFST